MSSQSVYDTATKALNAGIIAAIVVGSVIRLGLLICLYCVCCRKTKSYPGAVLQPQPYPGTVFQTQTYPAPPYYNPPPYKV